MKTFFTFILLFVVALSNYAQKTTSSNQKSGAFSSGITAETQSFSISKVYPNPVKDFVTVDIQSGISGSFQICLYNILGTEVKKLEPIYLSQGDQALKIDLSSFKTGIYILKITGSDQVCSKVLKKN